MIFDGCVDSLAFDEMRNCIRQSLVPMVVTYLVIFLKIVCLRGQRVLLWSAFLGCLITQMWILKHVIGKVTDFNFHVNRWMMFLPSMILCLAVDVQFAIQVKTYKPKAFIDMPHKFARFVGYFFAFFSMLASIAALALSFITFAKQSKNVNINWIYNCFIIKAICWSPFIGWDFVDMFFEHLYLDT